MSTTSRATSRADAASSNADVTARHQLIDRRTADGVRPEATSPTAAPPHLARRVVARLVDMVTVVVLCLIIVVLGFAPLMDWLSDRVDPSPWHRALMATVLYALVASVYEVIFLVARGQTPGKDLLNVRVVDASSGSTPGLRTAIVRTVPFAVLRMVPGPWLGTAACGVLGVSAPFDADRRGLHDRLAGTRVETYDADEEESDGDPMPTIDREDFFHRYGPRSWWEQVMRRVRR